MTQFTAKLIEGTALKRGSVTVNVAGLSQGQKKFSWRAVLAIKEVGSSSEKRVIRGAIGGLVGAAAGSLLGPVGTVAGFAAGVGSQGFKRYVSARILIEDGLEAIIVLSANDYKEMLDWWQAHRS